MSGFNIDQDAYRVALTVPEDVVGMPADGDWAAWHGVWSDTSDTADSRNAIVLVSITVTGFHPHSSPGDELARRLRSRHKRDDARIAQFTTADGNPAVSVSRVVTQQVSGRDVTTGQAQAFVAYPGAGALGVVSGVALDPGDLDRAMGLVTEIASGMSITSAPAAA